MRVCWKGRPTGHYAYSTCKSLQTHLWRRRHSRLWVFVLLVGHGCIQSGPEWGWHDDNMGKQEAISAYCCSLCPSSCTVLRRAEGYLAPVKEGLQHDRCAHFLYSASYWRILLSYSFCLYVRSALPNVRKKNLGKVSIISPRHIRKQFLRSFMLLTLHLWGKKYK